VKKSQKPAEKRTGRQKKNLKRVMEATTRQLEESASQVGREMGRLSKEVRRGKKSKKKRLDLAVRGIDHGDVLSDIKGGKTLRVLTMEREKLLQKISRIYAVTNLEIEYPHDG